MKTLRSLVKVKPSQRSMPIMIVSAYSHWTLKGTKGRPDFPVWFHTWSHLKWLCLTQVLELTLFMGGIGNTGKFSQETDPDTHLHSESLLGNHLGINSCGVVKQEGLGRVQTPMWLCDGWFCLLTLLGHGVPIYLAKRSFWVFLWEGFWVREHLDWWTESSRLPSPRRTDLSQCAEYPHGTQDRGKEN